MLQSRVHLKKSNCVKKRPDFRSFLSTAIGNQLERAKHSITSIAKSWADIAFGI